MVFSSFVFLIIFLPLTIVCYYLVSDRLKNIILILASMLFYAWGSLSSVPILILSIVANYFFALAIEDFRQDKRHSKLIMIFMLVFNVGLLVIFKYLSPVATKLGIAELNLTLPLGISFFTFSAISYVLDVYFDTAKAEKNVLNVALYISFFPKVISGPIVKWDVFEKQMRDRQFKIEQFSDGVKRFIVGLGKKVIISNVLGIMADRIYADIYTGQVSAVLAWLGVIWYIFQLYYDFSGYSDMAVGLGKMFGFQMDENFDYPFISKSVAEYWARWHITLGTWIKHYIYTPVFRACSKRKNKKTGKRYSIKTSDYTALLVSWLIIGPWHGVGIKFLFYGLYYCFFIFIERFSDEYKKKREKSGRPVKPCWFKDKALPHIYLVLVIILGQMIFRADSLAVAGQYFKSMLGLAGNVFVNQYALYMLKENAIITIIALVLSLPVVPKIKKCMNYGRYKYVYELGEVVVMAFILIVSIGFGAISSYDPFIYFNF